MTWNIDDRLYQHNITEDEIPNLLDNFRQVIDALAYQLDKHNGIDIHLVESMAEYFRKKTGVNYHPQYRWLPPGKTLEEYKKEIRESQKGTGNE